MLSQSDAGAQPAVSSSRSRRGSVLEYGSKPKQPYRSERPRGTEPARRGSDPSPFMKKDSAPKLRRNRSNRRSVESKNANTANYGLDEEEERRQHNKRMIADAELPKHLVNDSWWRKVFGCEARNLLNNYPPLARAYLQLEWYKQHYSGGFKNPYHYSEIPWVPPIKKQASMSLPKKGESMKFNADPEALIDEAPVPKPVLALLQAGLWTQVIALMWRHLLKIKQYWWVYLIGLVFMCAAWGLPIITLNSDKKLEDLFQTSKMSKINSADNAKKLVDDISYVWAAAGIWQTIFLGAHVVANVSTLIGERMAGTRDALTVAHCRGAAYYVSTFLDIILWALQSGIIGFVFAIALFNNLDKGTEISVYYGLSCFFMHLSFVIFGCVCSTLFKEKWGYKVVLLMYSLNLLPFIANVPKMSLNLRDGWLFLPAQYIVEMLQCLSTPDNTRVIILFELDNDLPMHVGDDGILSPAFSDFYIRLGMCAGYTLILWFLYMYMNEVNKDVGARKWHFPLTFCCKRRVKAEENIGHEHPWYLEQEVNADLVRLAREHKCASVVNWNVSQKVQGIDKDVLKNVSFTMYEGEIFVLMGQKKSGKSALLNSLAGLITPKSGEFSVYGETTTGVPNDFGACAQKDFLWDHLTVKQHMRMYAKMKGVDLTDKDIETSLEELRLYHEVDRVASHLSVTDKRRLGVALAFIGNPKLIILDQPTQGTYFNIIISNTHKKIQKL